MLWCVMYFGMNQENSYKVFLSLTQIWSILNLIKVTNLSGYLNNLNLLYTSLIKTIISGFSTQMSKMWSPPEIRCSPINMWEKNYDDNWSYYFFLSGICYIAIYVFKIFEFYIDHLFCSWKNLMQQLQI